MTIRLEKLNGQSQAAVLEQALEQAFNAAIITDADFSNGGPHIVYANSAFCRMTGYTFAELEGQNPKLLQGELTDPSVIDRLRDAIHSGEFFSGSTYNYRKDGIPYIVEWNISPVRDEQGRVVYFLSLQQDVTRRQIAERRTRMLSGALDVAQDAIFITDSQRQIVFVNHAFELLTGYSRQEVLGLTPSFLVSDACAEQTDLAFRQAIDQGQAHTGIMCNRTRDGGVVYVHQSVSPLHLEGEDEAFFVSISKDVTERIHQRQELESAVFIDPLTALTNRRGAELELQSLLGQVDANEAVFALVLCDVDHFKRFNDHYGHLQGDRVLRAVADTLAGNVRQHDLAARWGGEEFLILLVGADGEVGWKLADRLRTEISQISIEGLPEVTASFGVAQPQPGESLASLIGRADAALYRAKREGRNRTLLAE